MWCHHVCLGIRRLLLLSLLPLPFELTHVLPLCALEPQRLPQQVSLRRRILRVPSRHLPALLRHDYFVHAFGAAPHHVLPRRVAVVVRAWRLTGWDGVVVAHMASTSMTIIVICINTIRRLLHAARCSISKVHVRLHCVGLLLQLSPRSLRSIVVSATATSTAASSISSTPSAALLLLHWHHVHPRLLDWGQIHYLRDAVRALELRLKCRNLLLLRSVRCGEVGDASLRRGVA